MAMGMRPDEPLHPWTFVAKESMDRAAEALEAGYRHPAIPGFYLVVQMGELTVNDPFGRHWQFSILLMPVAQWVPLQDGQGAPMPVVVLRTQIGQLQVQWIGP